MIMRNEDITIDLAQLVPEVVQKLFKNCRDCSADNQPIAEIKLYLTLGHEFRSRKIKGKHDGDIFSLFLLCTRKHDDEHPFSIDVDYEFRVISVTGKGQPSLKGSCEFKKDIIVSGTLDDWDKVIKNHMVDNTVIVECDVVIKKMTGIVHERKIDFGKPRDHLTYVVLTAGGKEFNVSKAFLATVSPYFNAMFVEKPTELEELEVSLKNVDSELFQSFLEVIHGESSITSENVESLLKLAIRFDVKTMRSRCEEFLLICSEISKKNKLRIADAYELTILKIHCLENVQTAGDVRALLPADVRCFSRSTLAALLQKTISNSNTIVSSNIKTSIFERKFTLRHAIKNFPELKTELSQEEENFGVPWCIYAEHAENSFSLYLKCTRENDEARPWSIDVDYELRVVTGKKQLSRNTSHEFKFYQSWGWPTFHGWDGIIRDYMVDDTVIIECDVTIKKMAGIAAEKIMDFRKANPGLTDVVLIADEEKFNVSKTFLATMSPVFDIMFFFMWPCVFVLKDVDRDSFQTFLEAVYGEFTITSENVEIILKLAVRFDVKSVKNRCEEFLFHCKHISNKNKFRIADAYGLTALQNHFLKDVKTSEDVRALLPADVRCFSRATLAVLLQKTISPP